MSFVVLTFLACGAVVVAAGIILGRSADVIASLTGLGRVWTGAALVAVATSLPELVTDVSAVRIRSPDLAAGDLFGSSLTNMLILGVIEVFAARMCVQERLSFNNVLTARLAIILNALGALFVLFHSRVTLLGLRPESTLLLVIYLLGMRAVFRCSESGGQANRATSSSDVGSSGLLGAVLEFVFGALLVFGAAPTFARSAKQLADVSGLRASFVGTFLVGFSTALPEFATSLTAVRIGAFDLAFAALYGSSACNMAVFFALDLVSPQGSIFAALETVHALSGFLATALMVLGLATVTRARSSGRLVEPASGLMLASYALAVWLVHAYGH